MGRISIPVAELEFEEGGNTIWVHSPQGTTVLRLKTSEPIHTAQCKSSPTSHADAMIDGPMAFCVGEDAEHYQADTGCKYGLLRRIIMRGVRASKGVGA